MTDQYVTVEAFADVVKKLMERIIDLHVDVMVFRAALMQQGSLPIPAEELRRLHQFFENWEHLANARKALQSVGNTENELLEFLKNFEGPLQ